MSFDISKFPSLCLFKAGTVFPDECKIKLSSDEAHTCLAALAEFYVICDSKNPSKKIISRYLDLKLSSHEVMYILTFLLVSTIIMTDIYMSLRLL